MSFRANQPTTGRDFFFSPSGDDTLSGTSDENPVAEPATAIDRVNALLPAPSAADPASINATVTGTYQQTLVLPDSTSINCNFASVFNFTPGNVMIDSGTQQESIWGALLNFGDGSTTYMIDAQQRHTADVNAMVVGSQIPAADDVIGFEVKGACDDVFIKCVEAELHGKRCMYVNHTATTTTPVIYKLEKAEFFDDDQTLFKIDGSPTERIEVSVQAIKRAASATSTTNSTIFDVASGQTNVLAQSLDADYVGKVGLDSQLGITCNIIIGSLQIDDGGESLIRSGVFVGDINIDAGGRLEAIINVHAGTLTNNGQLNGIINGKVYGNWNLNPSHYGEFFDSDSVSSTGSTSYQDKIDDTTQALPAGRYQVAWGCEITNNSGDKPCEYRVRLDGATINEGFYPPKFEDEYLGVGDFTELDLSEGTHQLEIQWRSTSEGGTARIRRARIKIIKVDL